MFCAFEGPPRIVRLHGRGEAIELGDPRFPELRAKFPEHAGERAVVRVDVDRIADSCGFDVPLYNYAGERTQLSAWVQKKGDEAVAAYRTEHNRSSIDGIPGL